MNGIENDFKFLKKIGKGSFADVYLASDLGTQELVAVKAINKSHYLRNPGGTIALINEISIMKKLDHPNIIKIHRIYESDTHVSLVLDYLEGGELFQRILQKGRYDEKDASKLTEKLLRVLDYMSSLNIVHRDIKLENIILVSKESDVEIKLIDFGLACEITQDVTLRCGSPGYISPEILKKQPYNTKVDVFSVGIILYIMLSGRSPFHGRSNDEILIRNRDCRLSFDSAT